MGYRSYKTEHESWKRNPIPNVIYYCIIWTIMAIFIFKEMSGPYWKFILLGVIYVLLIAATVYTGIAHKREKEEKNTLNELEE